jgi:hypothetical protein
VQYLRKWHTSASHNSVRSCGAMKKRSGAAETVRESAHESSRYTAANNAGPINNVISFDEGLAVSPSGLVFLNCKSGLLYVMTFCIRNASSTSQRIRISPPETRHFAVNYVPCGSLAPGMDMRAEVECQIPSNGTESEFHDHLVVRSAQCCLRVPLIAKRPLPCICFDSFVNFGAISLGSQVSRLHA